MYLSDNSINPTDMIMDAKKGLREKRDKGGGDKLFKNDDNFFTNVSEQAGIYSSAIGFGLGIAIGDVNRDNWPDIYVANDFFEKDYLYLNNGDGTFTESIDQVTTELSLGSMGVDIADMNNDGYPEIFVTEMLPDNECDFDLVVNNIDAAPFIYRNTAKNNDTHFVSMALKTDKGTTAIGTKVTLSVKGVRYYQELFPMRGVMSTVDDRLNFGIGLNTLVDSMEIIWPDGTRFVEKNIPIDIFLTYQKSKTNDSKPMEKEIKNEELFSEVTDSLGIQYGHKENDFVDFDRERLLYQMTSNEGPKMAVADVNGDGKEDFFIGGAKGSPGSLYVRAKKGFRSTNMEMFEKDRSSEDMAALFFDADNDKDLDLLVTSGAYEFSNVSFSLLDRLYLNDGSGNLTS